MQARIPIKRPLSLKKIVNSNKVTTLFRFFLNSMFSLLDRVDIIRPVT